MAAAPENVSTGEPQGSAAVDTGAQADADATETEEEAPEPVADPDTCKGLALALDVFEEAVLNGEFDDSPYMFYLEPSGVLNAHLLCARSYPAERKRAGIVMTRDAWKTKTVFFDDGINPERYDLHFPKEFGYVKSIQHYQPESREHAKYPWSKKY